MAGRRRPLSPQLEARCAELEARGRRFSPSLSWAVHDALFSFWRLTRAQRRVLELRVPRFSVQKDTGSSSLRACLDWRGVLDLIAACEASSSSDNSTHQVHVAWALALHAETAFDEGVAKELGPHGNDGLTSDVRLATDHAIVHGATVRRLLSSSLLVEHGDFYLTFVVLITVLEKALYDLYYHHEDGGAAADTDTKKKNMILRDLLQSAVLQKALPPGMMALLKILFLPSGLNLRNLVWHGFVAPAQFPRSFACLSALLLLELPRFFGDSYVPTSSSSLFQLQSFNERFLIPAELQHTLQDKRHLRALVTTSRNTSVFIPHGRERLIQRALNALVEDGDELWFLFALLPVLEHAVRSQFVRSNTVQYGLKLDDFRVAQIDQYYSTLDGFGQRDKHQVLLHAEIAGHDDPMALNALYRTMPRAAMAVCLDLFMMAAGPNVRAKLCHGEANLTALLSCPSEKDCGTTSVISQLVLLTWVTLCESYDKDHSSHDPKRPRLTLETSQAISHFERTMGSSFHPFVQLCRIVGACEARLKAFEALCETWSHVKLTDIDPDDASDKLSKLEWFARADCDGPTDSLLAVVDKTTRVHEFECLLSTVSLPPIKKPKSFVEFLVTLRAKVASVMDRLAAHNTTMHSTLHPASANGDQFKRCLLALSDVDGLSVSACMMDTLASIDRSLSSFESRLSTLAALIQDGSARTNQRRAFLNNVFLLPVLERLQSLAFAFVGHQIQHLEMTALKRAAAIDGDSSYLPELCPDARKFEQLQRKLLQFVTAFEGCTGSSEGAQKSGEKALQLALQFLESNAVRAVLL